MTYVSAHYLADIISKCTALGVPRGKLINLIPGGEGALIDPIRRIDSAVILDVYILAAELSGHEHIGLIIGQQINIASMYETGKVLPMCSTLREVILMLGRYHRLTQTVGHTDLTVEGDIAHVNWRANYEDHEKYHTGLTAIYSGFVNAGRWILWGQSYEFTSMDFRVKRPENADIYEKVFGCPVRFEQAEDRLSLKAKYLDLPIVSANPEMFDVMTERLDGLLSAIDGEDFIIESVCASIRRQIRNHAPTLDVAAQHIGVPERRIRQALKQHGTNFRALVDNERIDVCMRYMKRGLRIADIAYRLGYHDQAAFTRAFKRWYGVAPSVYMREHFQD